MPLRRGGGGGGRGEGGGGARFWEVCGFVFRKFQQARTARVCILTLLLMNDLVLRYFLHLLQVSSDFTLK